VSDDTSARPQSYLPIHSAARTKLCQTKFRCQLVSLTRMRYDDDDDDGDDDGAQLHVLLAPIWSKGLHAHSCKHQLRMTLSHDVSLAAISVSKNHA